MNDYTMEKEEKAYFILRYEVEQDKIRIYFASDERGEKYEIPYSLENEKKVLTKMKEQVTQSKDYQKLLLTKRKRAKRKEVSYLASWIVTALAMIPATLLSQILAVPLGVLLLLESIALGSQIHQIAICEKDLNDIKKNLTFLQNEERLNQKIRENENMLSHVSKKTKKIVNSIPKEKEVFTINTMDEIPKEDLEQILNNIEKEESFAFEYHPKTKRKSKTKEVY